MLESGSVCSITLLEKYHEEMGVCFLDLLVLQQGIIPRLDFGMTYNVRSKPLR